MAPAERPLHLIPTEPTRLSILIDNNEGAEYPENPWTLNAYIGADPATEEPLYIRGEGALIEGDVPAQLRALAEAIENGWVTIA
jgi:hypothetical protein